MRRIERDQNIIAINILYAVVAITIITLFNQDKTMSSFGGREKEKNTKEKIENKYVAYIAHLAMYGSTYTSVDGGCISDCLRRESE